MSFQILKGVENGHNMQLGEMDGLYVQWDPNFEFKMPLIYYPHQKKIERNHKILVLVLPTGSMDDFFPFDIYL